MTVLADRPIIGPIKRSEQSPLTGQSYNVLLDILIDIGILLRGNSERKLEEIGLQIVKAGTPPQYRVMKLPNYYSLFQATVFPSHIAVRIFHRGTWENDLRGFVDTTRHQTTSGLTQHGKKKTTRKTK